MSLLREIPPTAGLPIYGKDILSGLFRSYPPESLEKDFKEYLNTPYATITYSGTAAFYLILEALKSVSRKKNVIIPSFICPLLPLAIKKAGLNAVACDINKENFGFELHLLERLCSHNDTLAIVATHLAGIPVDIDPINQIAKDKKIFLRSIIGRFIQRQANRHTGRFFFFQPLPRKGPDYL